MAEYSIISSCKNTQLLCSQKRGHGDTLNRCSLCDTHSVLESIMHFDRYIMTVFSTRTKLSSRDCLRSVIVVRPSLYMNSCRFMSNPLRYQNSCCCRSPSTIPPLAGLAFLWNVRSTHHTHLHTHPHLSAKALTAHLHSR